MKKLIKKIIPNIILGLINRNLDNRDIKNKRSQLSISGKTVKEIFTKIYRENYWRGENSVSGSGSDDSQVQTIIKEVNLLITKFKIKTILDLPCGDFNWMRNVNLKNVDYVGADIVEELIINHLDIYSKKNIHFKTLDLVSDLFTKYDLIINRDCLVHLSFDNIYKCIKNIKQSKSKYLLTTTFTERDYNIDILTGEWHPLNLHIKPFNFPKPKLIINENCSEFNYKYKDKSLALYLIDEIQLPSQSYKNF